MICPKCGYDMGKRAKCLRCGYTVTSIIPIDPEKIEREEEPASSRKEINPDDVHVSRAGGGSIFDDIFGGSIFGRFGNIFGSLFGDFDIFGTDIPDGYEYDPKYYDDFGNEIYVPDEFERESVEIDNAEILEGEAEESDGTRESDTDKSEEYGTRGFRKFFRRKHHDDK